MDEFIKAERQMETLFTQLKACRRRLRADLDELLVKCHEEDARHNHGEDEVCDDAILVPRLDAGWVKLSETLREIEGTPSVQYSLINPGQDLEQGQRHGVGQSKQSYVEVAERINPSDIYIPPFPTSVRIRFRGLQDTPPSPSRIPGNQPPRSTGPNPILPGPDSESGVVTDGTADVYVYNLRAGGLQVTELEVRDFLQGRFGRVLAVKRIRCGQYPGVRCQFEDERSVDRCLAARPLYMGKHPLFVQQRDRAHMQNNMKDDSCQVFLPDLNPKYREGELLPVFAGFGQVLDLQIKEGPKGVYGLVSFVDARSAKKAITAGSVLIRARERIVVKPFTTKRAPTKI